MMFAHIFTYRLKCLLRDRETVFWTLMFPLFLATFFSMALSNVGSSEAFQPIDLAVVDDAQYQQNATFKSVITDASNGDDRLFNLTVASKDKAEQLLKDNKVMGYIVGGEPIKLVVNKSGLSQTIIKSFIDDYNHTMAAITSLLTEDPARYQDLMNDLGNREEYVKEVSASSAEPNSILAYFYSLIAMSCFYGSLLGNQEIMVIQANISPSAARVNVAPVHKLRAFIASSSASLLIHLVEMLMLLAYLFFALKVDFGSKIGYTLLTMLVGSVAGLSFGAFISAIVKKSEGVKIAILFTTTMFCSFLSGMMYQDMKYIIAQKAPILSYLNPINLLTDAFYCLYYYDTLGRFFTNIAILCAFILLFCSGTYFIIRRRKYASL